MRALSDVFASSNSLDLRVRHSCTDPTPSDDLDAGGFDRSAAEAGHDLASDQRRKLRRPGDRIGVVEVPCDWVQRWPKLDDGAFMSRQFDHAGVDAQPPHRLTQPVVMGEDDDLS